MFLPQPAEAREKFCLSACLFICSFVCLFVCCVFIVSVGVKGFFLKETSGLACFFVLLLLQPQSATPFFPRSNNKSQGRVVFFFLQTFVSDPGPRSNKILFFFLTTIRWLKARRVFGVG